MPAESIPFYQTQIFWTALTALVAVLALILSQLPPVREMLKGAKLELDIYPRILITHKVGNPNILLHLIIRNTCGKSIMIKSAAVSLRRAGKEVIMLPAQNYLPNPVDTKQLFPFISFNLRPKEDWAYQVNFYNLFSREDDRNFANSISALKEQIMIKAKLSENKEGLVEADAQYLKPFFEMYKDRFIWQPGEFEMQLSINVDPGKANITNKYRFTLFESDSADLVKHKDYYKYGEGLFWGSDRVKGIIVEVIAV